MDWPHYIPQKSVWPALVICLFATPAMAGGITNLTDHKQVVEIQTSSGYIAREIPPGRSFWTQGHTKVRFQEKEFTLDPDIEYAVWQDGSFGPQRKFRRSRF
jgi:hypothetical protein